MDIKKGITIGIIIAAAGMSFAQPIEAGGTIVETVAVTYNGLNSKYTTTKEIPVVAGPSLFAASIEQAQAQVDGCQAFLNAQEAGICFWLGKDAGNVSGDTITSISVQYKDADGNLIDAEEIAIPK